MLTRDRIKTISKLAFPLSIAISANLMMDLIDIAMVGTLGHQSIAAVGLAAFSNTLVLALVGGIAAAVQGIVARRRGEGSKEPLCLTLNGGLLLGLGVGLPLAILCYRFTPFFFSLISSDPEVSVIGVPYLRTRYLAVPVVGMLMAFKGFWAGVERTKIYMLIILVMNVTNISVNYALIFGHFGAPKMGAQGAAVGTVTALCVGLIINLVVVALRFRGQGFLSVKPALSLLGRIMKLGMPANVQEFFFSFGYIVFFWMIGRLGTAELAVMNVQVRMSMLLLIVAASLGQASATLVSRTVGEGNVEGAAQWGWDAGKLGVIINVILGLPLIFFPRQVLSIFLHDPRTIEIAVVPFQLLGGTAGFGSLIWIFAYTLYSLGDGNRVMLVSFITQWLLFLPAVWVVGPHLHYGLVQISLVQVVYGLISTILITMIWASGRWKTVRF
ncbi:MAG TPA: MATE family efflux transporter [Thermoanaerobaculia bacterium]|jgi:putative MATE family efflux protein